MAHIAWRQTIEQSFHPAESSAALKFPLSPPLINPSPLLQRGKFNFQRAIIVNIRIERSARRTRSILSRPIKEKGTLYPSLPSLSLSKPKLNLISTRQYDVNEEEGILEARTKNLAIPIKFLESFWSSMTTRRFEDATYLRIGVLLVRGPAMTLVVAPAIISAGRAWVRVLDRGCGRTAVGYLRLVGLIRALVRLAGCSRRLVHPLLGTGPVTGSAGVMHRTSRPFTSPREPRSLHRRANQRSTPRTTSLLAAAPRAGPSSLFTAPRRAHHPRRPDLTRAQRGPGWMMDRVRQGRTVSPPSGQLSRALLLSPSVVVARELRNVYVSFIFCPEVFLWTRKWILLPLIFFFFWTKIQLGSDEVKNDNRGLKLRFDILEDRERETRLKIG